MSLLRNNRPELILIAGFALVFMILASYPVSDGDFFWHVHSGQQILADHKLPEQDTFSFTTTSFVDDQSADLRISVILKQYWLAQIFLSSFYETFGDNGIVTLRVLIFTAILVTLYLWGRLRAPASVSAFFTILTASLLLEYPAERPQIYTFLLAPIVLFLLEKNRSDMRWRQGFAAWLLPAIMLLWGNLHGGYLLGFGFCLSYLIGYGLNILRGIRADGRYLLLLSASAILPFVNPCGFDTLLVSFSTDRDYLAMVYETITPVAAFRNGDYFWGYWLCLFLALAALFIVRRAFVFEHVVIILGVLGLSLFGLRYMIFLLMSFPLFIGAYARLEPRRSFIALAVSLGIFLAGANYADAGRLGISPRFPIGAADFLRSNLPVSNIYSHYDWGGYLGFILPKSRVFIDGRGLVPAVAREYNAIKAADGYRDRLRKYGAEVIVMPAVGATGGSIYPLIKALCNDPYWQLVYQDDVALVFISTAFKADHLPPLEPLDKKRIFTHIIERTARLLPAANREETLALLQARAESQMLLGDYVGARESCAALLDRDAGNVFAGRFLGRLDRIR